MHRGWLLSVTLLGACITDRTVVCGDQRCPVGSVCTAGGCATAAAAAACVAHADGEQCTTSAIANGACLGGACHEIACGDSFVDTGEVCDDGNTADGDGCAATCLSTEVCGNEVVDLVSAEECDDAVRGLSGDGCSSRCKLEIARWFDVSPRVIGGRAGVALAYDGVRQRMLAFGGTDDSGALDETWQYEGTRWVKLDPITSPPPRVHAAITYDAKRMRVVVFGGAGTAGRLGDTWEWDGNNWTERHPSVAPPAREGSVMVYDAVREEIVLFGGTGAVPIPGGGLITDDTWSWDGTSWTQKAPTTKPSPRFAHAMGYDPVRELVVLYGGTIGNISFLDTWEWNGTTWTQRTPATTPNVSARAAMAWDPVGQKILLTGGGATYHFGGADWTLLSSGTLASLELASAGLDASVQRVMLFGGRENNASLANTTYYWNAGWTPRPESAVAPAMRSLHAMAEDPLRGQLILFGGFAGAFSNQTWVLKGGTWALQPTVGPPSARGYTQLVYDRARDRQVLFGGFLSPGVVGDTWILENGGTWSRLSPASSPTPRYNHALAYDIARDRIVLFGGYGVTHIGQTWEFDGAIWTQNMPAPAPSPRAAAGMAYDPDRARIVLFGGNDATTLFDDTWEWDGSTWTRVMTPDSPGSRFGHSMAWDPGTRRIVLVGGNSNVADTWEYDGTNWTNVSLETRAPVRFYAPLVYDSIGRRFVRFGGLGNAAITSGETWALERGLESERSERCRVDGEDLDGDTLAGCADPDCWGRCSPLCGPGTTCDASLPRCGDGTCSSIEDTFLCPGDCP